MIKRQGSGARETFTVRKQSFGVGVERTFPVHSPKIEQLEVVARGDVRRAKLYYLRGRVGKRARVAERRWGIEDDLVIAEAEEPSAVDSEGVAPGGGRGRCQSEEDAEGGGRGGEAERGRAPRTPAAEAGARGGGRAEDEPRTRPRRRGRRPRSRRRRGRGFRGRPGLIPKPTTGRGALVELVVIVALAIGLALGIQAFVVKPYQIPSESMEPTLDVGQRVLVNRVSLPLGADPEVGDIVVFHPPAGRDRRQRVRRRRSRRRARPAPSRRPRGPTTNFIKRVVAGPGDTLCDRERDPDRQRRAVRGRLGNPPVRRHRRAATSRAEITIPPDHYFMMGDNRGASDDSRYWGPVPRDWIIGKAFFTYWPPDRIGIL